MNGWYPNLISQASVGGEHEPSHPSESPKTFRVERNISYFSLRVDQKPMNKA